jgi:hypothetical protein
MGGQYRPYKYGPGDRREYIVSNGEVEIRCINDARGNPIYYGRSSIGSSEADLKWQICMMTYDANDGLLTKKWAENPSGLASSDYEFAWSLVLTYTYS